MGKLSSAKRIGNGLVFVKGAAHPEPPRRGSHHASTRRRARPEEGFLEDRKFGLRGNAPSSRGTKKAKR